MSRYRYYRSMGFSRRSSLMTYVPARLEAAYAALRGRPVAYRLRITDGVLTFDATTRGAFIAECRSIEAEACEQGRVEEQMEQSDSRADLAARIEALLPDAIHRTFCVEHRPMHSAPDHSAGRVAELAIREEAAK
jgi:hypothetical protein